MCSKGFFKRLAPLALVFAAGLLIGATYVRLNYDSNQYKTILRLASEKNVAEDDKYRLEREKFSLEQEIMIEKDKQNLNDASYQDLIQQKAKIEKRLKELKKEELNVLGSGGGFVNEQE